MSPWPFVLGAYLVTLLAVVVEVLAVRRRHRIARELAEADELAATVSPAPIARRTS